MRKEKIIKVLDVKFFCNSEHTRRIIKQQIKDKYPTAQLLSYNLKKLVEVA